MGRCILLIWKEKLTIFFKYVKYILIFKLLKFVKCLLIDSEFYIIYINRFIKDILCVFEL